MITAQQHHKQFHFGFTKVGGYFYIIHVLQPQGFVHVALDPFGSVTKFAWIVPVFTLYLLQCTLYPVLLSTQVLYLLHQQVQFWIHTGYKSEPVCCEHLVGHLYRLTLHPSKLHTSIVLFCTMHVLFPNSPSHKDDTSHIWWYWNMLFSFPPSHSLMERKCGHKGWNLFPSGARLPVHDVRTWVLCMHVF